MPTANVVDAELFAVLKAASRLLVAAGHFAECTNASFLIQEYHLLDADNKPPLPHLDVNAHASLMAAWLQFHDQLQLAETKRITKERVDVIFSNDCNIDQWDLVMQRRFLHAEKLRRKQPRLSLAAVIEHLAQS